MQTVAILLVGWSFITFWRGSRKVKTAHSLTFFSLRRRQLSAGWRLMSGGVLLSLLGFSLIVTGPRALAVLITPTPSHTPKPSATLTPTITPLPTATLTPTVTPTPLPTSTPVLPVSITSLFAEVVTPNPQAAFGPFHVVPERKYPPAVPDQVFERPPETLYGLFGYDHVPMGVRWTALWLCEQEVVCVDTKAWDGAPGGWGYTECAPEQWTPGAYEIQIFLGLEWKISTRFVILRPPPS